MKTVARELARCKLDPMAVQEIDGTRLTVRQQTIIRFIYGNGNDNYHLGAGLFGHKLIRSPVKSMK